MSDHPIDFVITWVDGEDVNWLNDRNRYEVNIDPTKLDNRKIRYRAWDNFRFLFRGIEQNAPWVNKVYLITYGHIPAWLNVDHPKLVIVNHADYIPHQYLPTFNSDAIEFNMHRIEGLSEQFVAFNDDMFIIRQTNPTDFFYNGKPCDSPIFNPVPCDRVLGTSRFNLKSAANVAVINSYFDKKDTIKNNFLNWFSIKYGAELFRTLLLNHWPHFVGFVNWHMPYSICKSTIQTLWDREPELMNEVSSHKFRVGTDVNIWLFLYWQYASNNFHPRNPNVGFKGVITSDLQQNKRLYDKIVSGKCKLLCLNDEADEANFEDVEKQNIKFFESMLPNKSSFER